MSIRVLRILEYIYDGVESMEADQAHWYIGINGTRKHKYVTIRSATLPAEYLDGVSDSSSDTGNATDDPNS